jgi:hypothetical protein
MGAILDVIHKIRERPGIILGRPSAGSLHAFLSGYSFARKDSEPGDYEFLNQFNRWVHDRYEITTNQGWAKIIEFFSVTEADQMTLFWKLLDEFLAQQKPAKKKVS